MFYTVQSLNEGTWLYNFNYFYSWNGCSNQVAPPAGLCPPLHRVLWALCMCGSGGV